MASNLQAQHDASVAVISSRVKHFHSLNQAFRVYHGSTHSTRPSQHYANNTVDVSMLTRVLRIDTDKKTALVEANVPMDQLVRATLKHGLIPPIVMEFPGITVGGGFAGTAGESSSFRYSTFEHTVSWIKIVLGNGEVVTASATEREDLFYGAGSSHGTLGVITLLEVQLVEAKKFVELTYYPVDSLDAAVRKFKEEAGKPETMYMDGILFARDRGLVCIGQLADSVKPGSRIQRFCRAADPWFYTHAEELMGKLHEPVTEAVPLVDYFFRYDRGAFWTGKYAFDQLMVPFNRVTRWILHDLLHARKMSHALHSSGLSASNVIQDIGIPYSTAGEFFDFVNEVFPLYPVWLCPVSIRGASDSPSAPPGPFMHRLTDHSEDDTFLNFGIWGPGPKRRREFVDLNRALEKKAADLRGVKVLYAHAYYTEEEFWQIYDKEKYDALRGKYFAQHLPTVYDKVKVDLGVGNGEEGEVEDGKGKPSGIKERSGFLAAVYGVAHLLLRSEYILKKK
ncbi:hypothetical protein AJ80_06910 [Polytolypa hystricis UAMH7299]|uniref:Delta(24)-sterol reductase n=1 Tax=Polytolypa hystricis (strain UAMH7299) TaxID=1447883 RepID=A0A2B7XSL5_POLH7|nr:hypothetical protein AJ80_06910 [Polytolypa hystricis UAMH7299]